MLGFGNSLVRTDGAHEQRYSIGLDGVNDYIETNFPIDEGRNCTMSVWAIANDGGPNRLFGLSTHLFLNAGGVGDDRLFTSYNAGTFFSATLPSTWDDGNWHHYVFYFDKDDADDCKIWFDGSPITNTSLINDSGSPTAFWDNLIIGSGTRDSVSHSWNGSIGDFGAWNAELTNTQVAGIYNAGRHHNLNIDIGDYNQSSTLEYYLMMGNGIGDMMHELDTDFTLTYASGLLKNQVGTPSGLGFGDELLINGEFDTGTAIGVNGSGWVSVFVDQTASDDDSTVEYDGGGLTITREHGSDEIGIIAKTAGGANILSAANKTYRIEHTILAKTHFASLSIFAALTEDGTKYGDLYQYVGGPYVTYHIIPSSTTFGVYHVGLTGTFPSIQTIDNMSLKIVGNGDYSIIRNGGTFEDEY
jgi:hypothetical protein